ncbi:TetR/AcrR family transcriptional regulator [Actinomadura sp. NPDC048955]|uniref:TetR/AcrR family transcriptional regulator n=1 Tax=Actinomadura sp. NPDC048955 TaxID=3158228 RepID=UPI0033F1DDE7
MVSHEPSEGDGVRISEQVLTTAARLFSELGYDELTARNIADACNVDAAVVTDAYGGKSGVYLAVMERLTQERMDYLSPAVAAFTPDFEGLIRLIDRYLDYCLEHQELPSIWMHRWMSDATDFPDLEARYGTQPIIMLVDLVAEAVADDVDPELFTWQVIWAVHSVVRGGIVGVDGVRRHLDDVNVRQRFRRSLHQMARWAATR